MDARLTPLLAAMRAAEAAAPPDAVLVLAIDGRAAAGKSTLAALLADAVGGGVVQMDDFFLPAALRTPARYALPGGNVHHERFAAEVLPLLRQPEAFSYRRFDCAALALGAPRAVAAGRWRIVEGAYSCHPALGDYMDLRAFADVEPAEQLRRIARRNGAEKARVFAEKWIPLEEAYLREYAIRDKADVIL